MGGAILKVILNYIKNNPEVIEALVTYVLNEIVEHVAAEKAASKQG